MVITMQSEAKIMKGGCMVEKTDMPEVDGYQLVYKFDNGYGASVVKHNFSYGGKKGLFEIALCKGESQICMPPITAEGDTVKGFLTKEQVIEIIETTRDLPGTV